DAGNRRTVSAKEIARLRGDAGSHSSARNRLRGTVRDVKVDGLLAQVEILVTEPARVVAIVTRDAVEELGLKPGAPATAVARSNPAGIHSVYDLRRPGVKLDVAAPGVPVGDYTRVVLHNLGLDEVATNVVSNETDVRDVLAKVALGEADAGFVYTTDARTV